jgi:hypothetical protein
MNARRENGKLIIEIDENALVAGVGMISEYPSFRVVDREVFLNFCVKQICDFGDSGDFGACSKFTMLLDDLVEHATECAAGIDQ